MFYKCRWCGCLFEKKHNKQQYCSNECRVQARLESKRRYANKRNLREKLYNTRRYNLLRLGSFGTTSRTHPKDSWKDEHRTIRSEKRMLGLE